MARFSGGSGGGSGTPGPRGPRGFDGDSAYEVAVENGFVGTEQEWLDSIGGNADIADFVFTAEEGQSKISLPSDRQMRIEAGATSDLYLTAGDEIYIRTTDEDIRLQAGDDVRFVSNYDADAESGYFWRMDSDGEFQLPGNGFISNPSGTSGDGYGNDTIHLVPNDFDGDNETEQRIIIDPTGPNHIHIRAGGDIDASTAELILGGEKNKVAISDSNKTVIIGTAALTQNTYVNANELSNEDLILPSTANIQEGSTVNVDDIEYPVTSFEVDPMNDGFSIVRATGASFVAGASYTFTIEESYNHSWEFNPNGYLSGPAMGGLFVSGLLNGEGDLWLGSSDYNVILSPGPENAAFVGDASNVNNQIATLGDIQGAGGSLVVPVNIKDSEDENFITFTRTSTGTARIATPQDDLSLRSARDITLFPGSDGDGNVYIGWGDAELTPDSPNRVATIGDINDVHGDITFDGVQIIGGGTASGDGLGAGTMELVPDADLYANDQYLVIDPTDPNHIHIRAGGVQDASTADLFLGAERTGIQVSDSSGDVIIRSKNPDTTNIYENVNGDGGPIFAIFADLSHISPNANFSVDVDGTLYVIDSAQVLDVEGSPVTELTATPATFVTGMSYMIHESNGENSWNFDSSGVLYGPVMGALGVQAIRSNGQEDLYVYGEDKIILDGTNGEFIGEVDPDNQIATIGDVNAGRFGASASYHSRVTQGPQASANTVQALTFSTTDWQTGIQRVDNTKIKMLSAGKYNIAFSAQFVQANNNGTVNIWLNKNGTPMAYTNTKLVIESNATYTVAAWNFFVDAAANDYYELIWSSSSTHTTVQYDPAQTINGNLHPEIPSIIVTVNQVG
jgi:hypothetical protein